MTLWQALKKAFGEIRLLKRSLLFWLGLGGVVVVFVIGANQNLGASPLAVSREIAPVEQGFVVEIASTGEVFVNGVKTRGLIAVTPDFEELRYKVVDEPGQFYEKLVVVVRLPKPIEPTQVSISVVAVHGVEKTSAHQTSLKTLIFEAEEVGPAATFTVVAQFPKGYFDFPLTREVGFSLMLLSPAIWLSAGLGLPLLTFLSLGLLFWRRRAEARISPGPQFLSAPPSPLPAAVVGVLVYTRVSTRELAATLLELARAGVVEISSLSKTGLPEFKLARKRLLKENGEKLLAFEEVLLSKLFEKGQVMSSRAQIEERLGRHIFSRKISEVYLAIYLAATTLGFFAENPSAVQARWRSVGFLAAFLGLVGFGAGFFGQLEPAGLLLLWAGMVLAGLLVVQMAPFLPLKSLSGRQQASQWLAFRRFLVQEKPLGIQEAEAGLFERYLPYAIVLGGEVAWAKRFLGQPFHLPAWYASAGEVRTLEDFAKDLFGLVGYTARALVTAHEPLVD